MKRALDSTTLRTALEFEWNWLEEPHSNLFVALFKKKKNLFPRNGTQLKKKKKKTKETFSKTSQKKKKKLFSSKRSER